MGITQVCSRCIMDTSVPGIRFDEKGVCNFCRQHDVLDLIYPVNNEKELLQIVEKIKKAGKGKPYDCVVGVSGGTDSSYTLHMAKEYGLRPLAVHFDNGWNAELAVTNIKKLCDKLKVDLYTYVVDWEEFKNLQISFLKASVPDIEIPTDVGIHAVLIKTATREKVKYVLNGHSFRAEGVSPIRWTYMDGTYINSVQKKFGAVPLKTFPNFTLLDMFYYNYFKGIKVVPFLNYLDYKKSSAKEVLKNTYGWIYSGGHHHESTYTEFIQSYVLPKKFNIDKRKTELSALIRNGLITRDEALKEINNSEYPFKDQVVEYSISKLGISKGEFEEIFNRVPKSFLDYPTDYPLIMTLKPIISFLFKLGLIPPVLFYKFYN